MMHLTRGYELLTGEPKAFDRYVLSKNNATKSLSEGIQFANTQLSTENLCINLDENLEAIDPKIQHWFVLTDLSSGKTASISYISLMKTKDSLLNPEEIRDFLLRRVKLYQKWSKMQRILVSDWGTIFYIKKPSTHSFSITEDKSLLLNGKPIVLKWGSRNILTSCPNFESGKSPEGFILKIENIAKNLIFIHQIHKPKIGFWINTDKIIKPMLKTFVEDERGDIKAYGPECYCIFRSKQKALAQEKFFA